MILIFLLSILSGCAQQFPKSRVECFRGDEKASYSKDYTRKDGCSVVVEKNGVILKEEAESIKTILESVKEKL